jgi:hypothetical protein
MMNLITILFVAVSLCGCGDSFDKFSDYSINSRNKIKSHVRSVLSGDASEKKVSKNHFIAFDLITLFFFVRRASEIYNHLVILIIATKYKDEMTIFDLALKMLCILHSFVNNYLNKSIVLYSVALANPESNWMTRISVYDF